MAAPQRGKWVIGLMLAVGLLAACSAWGYRYAQTRRAAQFWGGAAARTILKAEEVELLTLATDSPASGAEKVSDGTLNWRVVKARNVSAAHGLLNARAALVRDAHLEFDVHAPETTSWPLALRFSGSTGEFVVLLNLDEGRAKGVGRPGTVGIGGLVPGLRLVLEERNSEAERQ